MAKIHQYTQEKNGKTYIYYRRSLTVNGKIRTITAKDAKEWRDKADLIKREAEESYEVVEKNITVSHLAELFKKDGENYAPKTYEEREYILRVYIIPELGHVKLRALKNLQIRKFYFKLIETCDEGLKKLEHVHKILHRMLNWAVENEIAISRNPIAKGLIKSIKDIANRSKRVNRQEGELSLEDALMLLKEVEEKPGEIIFHLQMLHGLRIGEALGLTWENVDLEKQCISINQQVQDISMKLRRGTRFETDSYQITTVPKTVRSERVVPLQARTRSLLLKIPIDERQGFVFKGKHGGAVSYGNFRKRYFYPAVQALGMNLRTHSLRQFFGSWHLGVNRTDIMTVSKWMGHRDPRVTLSTYAKVLVELEEGSRYAIGNDLVPA